MTRIILISLFTIFTTAVFSQTSSNSDKPDKLTEAQKIEVLIRSIEKLEGAEFIRNGEAHTAKSAAEHLRMKLRKSRGRIKTAELFIEKIASESSMSGDPYLIKFANGKKVRSRDFLNKKLKQIEKYEGK